MHKTTNLMVCFIAVLCTLLGFPVTAQVQHTSETPVKGSVNDINDKILRLKGSEQGPIGELVDSILASHGIAQQVLAGTNGLRDQIVRAEAGYHSGARRGVRESDVARLINGLAAHFNTPDYTKTSEEEIRQLRVQLMPVYPRLIGMEPAFRGSVSRAYVLSDEMSPVEAIHVSATMIFQKMYNPEWQLTAAERKAHSQARHSSTYKPDFTDQRRSKEVLNAINASVSAMSLRDALAITNDSFSIMGIGDNQ